jgi:hypothetical protein
MNQADVAGAVITAVGAVWLLLVLASDRPSPDRKERVDSGAPLAAALDWAHRARGKALVVAGTILVVGIALWLAP